MTDWWDEYAWSLRRRGRSDETADPYRQSYERFRRWATKQRLRPRRGDGDVLNRWVDSLRDDLAPATVSVYWRNLCPLLG